MSKLVGSIYRGLVNSRIYNGLESYSLQYEYGYIYGGLFVTGYCKFIHWYARSKGIQKLLFLSRDGALLLKAYLHRYDLPRALYPICAQLAVAQTISAGIAAGMGNSQVQSAQSVKSITEGDTTVNFASGTSEAAAVANSNAIPVSPQQVLEANREILNRYRRGAVRP